MILDLIQGSPEWLAYRQTKIMATDAATICGVNPFKTTWQLYQEKMGLTIHKPANAAMLKGKELEPIALNMACEAIGIHFVPQVVQSDNYDWMAASLDGLSYPSSPLIEDNSVLEIKCSKKCFEQLINEDFIPEYYLYQMQHQMAVCDVKECFYFTYWNNDCYWKLIYRDLKLIDDMVEKEYKFWRALTNLEIPEECNEA